MRVNLFNPRLRQGKQAKIGISWTVFFFGPFPALFRGDWKWFLIMLIADVFTAGLSHWVFIFLYNKLYLTDLLTQGFEPNDPFSEQLLLSKGYFIQRQRYEETQDDFDFGDMDF